MDHQIKNIISKYIRVPAEQVTAQTVIDRSVMGSSIVVHRMYAQLANEGIKINDYTGISTFGQLLASINGNTSTVEAEESVTYISSANAVSTNELPVGIDIETISLLPVVSDFREDAFYTMHFAPSEIAYCILQSNPAASFAGLFAAKEAIIKADNSFSKKPFHSIIIDHLPGGKPVYPGFQLSISHNNDSALAVAIKNISLPPVSPLAPSGNTNFTRLSAMAAFLLSLCTLLLVFFKTC